MSNFYSYIYRHKAEEDYLLEQIAYEKRLEKQKRVNDFFFERKAQPGEAALFMDLIAIHSEACLLRDSFQGEYWTAKLRDGKIISFTRHKDIESAKTDFYHICNKEEAQEEPL